MPSGEKQLLLTDVLESLGVDLGNNVVPRLGNILVSACNTCGSCGVLSACRDWIESGANRDSAPDFCPNADILAEVMSEPSLRSVH
jgi:hypothetical protein